MLVSLFFFWNPKGFGQVSLEGRQMPILPPSRLGESTTVNCFVLEPRSLTPSPSLVIPRDLGSGLQPRQQLNKHSRGSRKLGLGLLAGALPGFHSPQFPERRPRDAFSFWSAGLPPRVERRGKWLVIHLGFTPALLKGSYFYK